jgi:hypothetical protein
VFSIIYVRTDGCGVDNRNMASYWNREAKPSQGNPQTPMKQLFRLDRRTIISESWVGTRGPSSLYKLSSDQATPVSGGAGALGLAIAEAVVESGGSVVLLDTREAPADSKSRFLLPLLMLSVAQRSTSTS